MFGRETVFPLSCAHTTFSASSRLNTPTWSLFANSEHAPTNSKNDAKRVQSSTLSANAPTPALVLKPSSLSISNRNMPIRKNKRRYQQHLCIGHARHGLEILLFLGTCEVVVGTYVTFNSAAAGIDKLFPPLLYIDGGWIILACGADWLHEPLQPSLSLSLSLSCFLVWPRRLRLERLGTCVLGFGLGSTWPPLVLRLGDEAARCAVVGVFGTLKTRC
ncbi:hypothetical protein IWX90DRAFT_108090 [Phyllosticta citrichinensis]|uniref:Uncharacterized protein n=1 Tax=Phyllosticta citrichinensis TaxID=1130410 RepID=A0ABR1Y364_9PEZI